MRPDAEFEPATLAHLVVGSRGRLLDLRRTPVRIVAIEHDTGHFRIAIEAFEDAGAEWQVPFEGVGRYQIERGAARATSAELGRFEQAVARFDRPLAIGCDRAARDATAALLDERRARARAWLHERALEPTEALQRFLAEHALDDLEEAFATRYVSNPHAGELVKGHRIVLAELGLVPYAGKIVRDPALFDGAFSKARRAEHLLWRLAFVRALFAERGSESVTLYRGLCCEGPPAPPRNDSFVSATFRLEVAQSFFADDQADKTGVLVRQRVPVTRLFMTHLETAQMNRHFREQEAVLLWEPPPVLF